MNLESICLSCASMKLLFVRDRHNYNTRHSAKDNYVIPLRHRKQDQNSFMYLGPEVWNSIPITIKNKTFIQFQKLYCDYLLENYT